MSSAPRGPKGKPGPAGAMAERKPPKPIFTPLNVGIVFIIIIVVAIAMFWKSVYTAKTAETATIRSKTVSVQRQNEVYRKKAEMLPKAERLNKAMDDKLVDEQKYFLPGQDALVEFFEEWFLDVLMANGIYSAKVEIKPDVVFKVSWLMDPIETLPPLEDAVELFKWEYIGEGTGTGEIVSRYPNFLEPLNITLSEFTMSYEQLKQFVENLQNDTTRRVTVHGFQNSGGEDNSYSFRTFSVYELAFTVYFMNPEGMTSGEVPPGMPGDVKL
jgi:hypothetical protein